MILKKRKWIAALLLVAVLCSLFVVKECLGDSGYMLRAALLYARNGVDTQYLATYSHLSQSFAANLEAEKVDVTNGIVDTGKYDIIYLDKSVESVPALKDTLVQFVKEGNYLFVPNELTDYFDLEFFGAKERVKLESIPTDIAYPETEQDLFPLREIIRDYRTIYESFTDIQYLSLQDYGYGLVADTAVSLADCGGVSLYGLNRFGKGGVFYANPLLPNEYHINSFTMEKTREEQLAFCNSTATANQIFLSEIAAYVSKLRYGFAPRRVLGSFGTPNMAWQLHYEEITAFENDSARIFGELCKKYNTIPSYTLIRNTYYWLSKHESVTYLLNDGGSYNMDFNENAYSSGTHVAEEDTFLALGRVENVGSYFTDNRDFMQMAYPHVGDFNDDGVADILCGSTDGKFYYFRGISCENRWKVGARQLLTDETGAELSVGAYSAPTIADYDSDGTADILSGSESGDIILFKGIGNFRFQKGRVILRGLDITRSMPRGADVNGDGTMDLVIGSVDGKIIICLGREGGYFPEKTITLEGETFAAPFVYDYNSDSKPDVVYGTFDGYIAKLRNNGGLSFVSDGCYDTGEKNYKGNNHIKFGNNAVPVLYDINGDGMDDLIAGELEYGLAVPIDSPYFKFRSQLADQIKYIKDNKFYLGVHFYTNQYASPEREAEELRLHRQAMDSYGADFSNTGVNMHTWRVSDFSPVQTINSAREAGFEWISGYRNANSLATPDGSSECVLACPFFLDFENRDMIVTNASVLGYAYNHYAHMIAKYDLPVSEYYHCDYIYKNEQSGIDILETLTSFQKEHSYSFVREDQLIKSSAAAYNMSLAIKQKGSDTVAFKASASEKGFDLYDEKYRDSVGIRIDFSGSVDVSKVGVKASVWRYDESKRALYLSLDGDSRITFGGAKKGFESITAPAPHILSVNIPAKVKSKSGAASVSFNDEGMMQVAVLGKIEDVSPGWDVRFEDGVSTVTKFGSASDLKFSFAKED